MGGIEGTGRSEARCLIWPARRSACLVASAAISRDLEAVSEKISLDFFAVSETSADERLAASAESSCDRFAARWPLARDRRPCASRGEGADVAALRGGSRKWRARRRHRRGAQGRMESRASSVARPSEVEASAACRASSTSVTAAARTPLPGFSPSPNLVYFGREKKMGRGLAIERGSSAARREVRAGDSNGGHGR